MKRICFICLGNICRSTMAEFMFKHTLETRNLQDKFHIESRATSSESDGWQVYDGTAKILDRFKIDYSQKRATKLLPTDAEKFDIFICMDDNNIANTKRILKNTPNAEICKLLDFTSEKRDVLDPYYTRNFEATFEDVMMGIEGMVEKLIGD